MEITHALQDFAHYYAYILTDIPLLLSLLVYFIAQIAVGSFCLNRFSFANLLPHMQTLAPRIFAATILAITLPAIVIVGVVHHLQAMVSHSLAHIFLIQSVVLVIAAFIYQRLTLNPIFSFLYAAALFLISIPIASSIFGFQSLLACLALYQGGNLGIIIAVGAFIVALISLIQTVFFLDQIPTNQSRGKIGGYLILFGQLFCCNTITTLLILLLLGAQDSGLSDLH